MEPAIKTGSFVLISSWYPSPKVGHIVLFELDGKQILKRISDITNEKVELLGDNTADSTDSRHFGTIPISAIKGRAILW